MPQIIAITNQKGGVGKTATASSIISGLTLRGKKVLGIDLDPQGALSFCLGVSSLSTKTIFDVFKETYPLESVILKTKYGDIAPANNLLNGSDFKFIIKEKEYLLKKAIETVSNNYDYIIIDTPPALNLLTLNAFVAADELIIPTNLDILSVLSVSQLKETVDVVRNYFNSSLEIAGILITKYNDNKSLALSMETSIRNLSKMFNTSVIQVKIHEDDSVLESPAYAQSIFEYAPTKSPAIDYANLVDLIIKKNI